MSLAPARGTQEVGAQLAALLARAPHDTPRLSPLSPAPAPPRRVAAVDGSNVTLAESGSHLLGAYRAGAVLLENGRPVLQAQDAPQVALLTHESGPALLARRLEELGAGGVALPRLAPGAALEHLRSLEELATALRTLDALREGDLLLMDGALQARAALPLTDRLVAQASRRGVDVVGVCKSTSLVLGGVPALAACQLAGRGFASATWYAPLATPAAVRGATYAARLSCGEERVFRFDVHAHDGDAPRVLAQVAALCGHPAYPGYPSPLAMAHNAVLLNEDARNSLRHQIVEAAVRAGASETMLDAAFLDYHDILELGA